MEKKVSEKVPSFFWLFHYQVHTVIHLEIIPWFIKKLLFVHLELLLPIQISIFHTLPIQFKAADPFCRIPNFLSATL